MTNSRELADQIFAWNEAGVDGVTMAMRLAPYPKPTKREAMRIVREELLPAAVEREVDREFERRGHYSTEEELAEMAAAGEAEHERSREAGMARLIVRCCELVGGTAEQPDCRPNRTLDAAAVWIDGAERGTCANWRRDGAILSTGRHVIQVKVPLDGPLEEDECCVDAGAYVTLHAGDIQAQQVGLKRLRSSD